MTKSPEKRYEYWAQAGLVALGIGFLVIGFVFVFARSGVGPTTVTTSGTSPDTTVITTAGHTALGSDVIDSFFLGAGVILVLSGAFYSRISKIGLPGGGSIELSPIAQAKLAGSVGAQLKDPEQIELAYTHAISTLTDQFWGTRAKPSDEAIEAAASAARDMVARRSAG